MLLKRVLSYFRLFEKGRSQSIDKYNRVDISLFKFTSNRERTLKKTHPFSLSPVDDLKILEYNRHILRKRIAQSISFLCEKGTMGFLPVSYTHLDVYKRQTTLSAEGGEVWIYLGNDKVK